MIGIIVDHVEAEAFNMYKKCSNILKKDFHAMTDKAKDHFTKAAWELQNRFKHNFDTMLDNATPAEGFSQLAKQKKELQKKVLELVIEWENFLATEVDEDHEERLRISDPFAELRVELASKAAESDYEDLDEEEEESDSELDGEEENYVGGNALVSDGENSNVDESEVDEEENAQKQFTIKLEEDGGSIFI